MSGGQSGVLSLRRGRERGQVKLYTVCGFIKYFFLGQIVNLDNHCSNFHFSPSDRDHRHQLLHLSQARAQGPGQERGWVRRLQAGGRRLPQPWSPGRK